MVKKLCICKHRDNYYRNIYTNSGDLVASIVGFAFLFLIRFQRSAFYSDNENYFFKIFFLPQLQEYSFQTQSEEQPVRKYDAQKCRINKKSVDKDGTLLLSI